MDGRFLPKTFYIIEDNLCTATTGRNHIALVEFCLHIAISVRLLRDETIFGGAMTRQFLHIRQLGYGFAILQIRLHNGAQWHRICSTMLQPLVASGSGASVSIIGSCQALKIEDGTVRQVFSRNNSSMELTCRGVQ